MPNGFRTIYIPAWRIWSSKISGVKINDRYNEFWLLNQNILSIQAVLYFFTCYTVQTHIIFSISFIEYTIKVLRKVTSADLII